MNIVEKFREIRDIPYRIPLSLDEPDHCCSGKSEQLFKIFKKAGYQVRLRVCTFLWSELSLSDKVNKVPHKNSTSHEFIEAKIGGRWLVVDSTWDSGLKSIFTINNWDGKSNTTIAVPVKKLLSPIKSLEYIKKISTKKTILDDLKRNGKFYRAFNNWLEEIRNR